MAMLTLQVTEPNFDELVLLGPPKHLRWSCWKALELKNKS